MQEKRSLTPGAILSPVPVILAGVWDERNQRPNLITIAWAGQVNSKPPMVSISVQPIRHSHKLLLETGEFSVNFVNRPLLEATDYCGVKSGRDVDKYKECGLDPLTVPEMPGAPGVAQSPVSLFCKIAGRQTLGSHDLFLGEVRHVLVDESLMDEAGALHLEWANLVCFAHGKYFALSEVLGFFGYAVASPEVRERRMADMRARHRK